MTVRVNIAPQSSRLRVVIVVPTLNERTSLPLLLPRIFAAVPDAEVLIVDDASSDGTGEWVEAEAKKDPRINLLRRAGPRGLGRAYVAGFAWAIGRGPETVAQMDADGSHDPAMLPGMLAALDAAEMAVGTRYARGGATVNWPWYRQALSRGAGCYVRLLAGLPSSDPTSGFRCFRTTALAALQPETLRSDGYAFQVEVLHRAWRGGARIVECPIVFTERAHGYSKLSGRTIGEAIWLGLWLGLRRFRR